MRLKLADGETASVLPTIQVPSYPAQDKNTLTGMVPPIAYTRVNASTPPVPDAGSAAQKSLAPMSPKTAQAFLREDPTMNMTTRPLVQDLVKQAMSNAAQRAQVAAEGARQMKLAGAPSSEPVEESPGSVPTDYALKLAAAVEYATPAMVDMSKRAAPNMPPPHLTETLQQLPEGVSHSAVGGTMPGPGQQGKGHHQPPTNPGTQKAMPQEHGATQLENTINEHVSGEQTTAMSGGQGKTAEALLESNLGVLSKIAKEEKKAPLVHRIGETLGRHHTKTEMITGGVGGAAKGGIYGGLIGGARSAAHHLAKNPDAIAHMVEGAKHGPTKALAEGADLLKNVASGARKGALTGGAAGGAYGTGKGYIKGKGGQGYTKGMAGAHKSKYKGTFEDEAKKEKKSSVSLVDNMLEHIKTAEDAINPANISAGPAVPPDTSASGQPGGQPVAGAPQGPSSLIGSNESAINYKKNTAYAPRKAELARYFTEPALSAATDRTLIEAFAHTPEAGVKISAAQLTKSAAARALLAKLAGEDKECKKCGKEKCSCGAR
jgi:hypothetical protein